MIKYKHKEPTTIKYVCKVLNTILLCLLCSENIVSVCKRKR